jgi:ubiquinone/menaquinone biosynthesis C-methylase UbiE
VASTLLDQQSAAPLHDLLAPLVGSWEQGTTAQREAVANEVYLRYNATLRYAVPWLQRAISLQDSEIVEIGCGTGSSSVAFAQAARAVRGYDISEQYVEAARQRAGFFQLDNVEFTACRPADLAREVAAHHPRGTDIVLLFAVLEHCTSAEALEYLRSCWQMLRPGGVLAVIETPNRLTYFDLHTSQLPFFHFLPRELKLEYFERSPRDEVVDELRRALEKSEEEALESLTRLGAGISYHEFELALDTDDLGSLLVCDGFEAEMLQWFPPNYEERLLQTVFQQHRVPAPLGFTRHVLNLAFRKPVDPLRTDATRLERIEQVTNFEERRFPAQIEQSQLFQRFSESTSIQCELSGPAWDMELGEGTESIETEQGLALDATTDDPNLFLPYALDRTPSGNESLLVLVELTAEVHTAVQIFYKARGDDDFDNQRSRAVFLTAGRSIVVMEIHDPPTSGQLRIDPGFHAGRYVIHRIGLRIA